MAFLVDGNLSFSRRSSLLRGAYAMGLTAVVALLQVLSSSTTLYSRAMLDVRNGGRLNDTTATTFEAQTIPLSTTDRALNEDSMLKSTTPYLSACVYYMDDNHRLAEWLAYHYYTMNLRHVILSIDYKSLTDPPSDLLKQWETLGLLQSAEIWHQRDYMDSGAYQTALTKTKNNVSLPHFWFGNAQSNFYRQCSKAHQALNRTWVSFHDTDEFWLLNPEKVPDSILRMSQPGSVLSYIVNGQANAYKATLSAKNESAEIEGNTSTPQETATMAPTGLPQHYHGPCITTHRLLFLPIESPPLSITRQVPKWIDPSSFETLRWRYHVQEGTRENGKSLLDVSRIDRSVLDDPKNFRTPHRILNQCHSAWVDPVSYVRLHHYLGSWEYFTYKASDTRADDSAKRFAHKLHKQPRDVSHAADDVRPWLMGFVQHVGVDTARLLFEQQGVLRPLRTIPLGIRMEQEASHAAMSNNSTEQ
jgi:hypothetical protein